MKTSIVIVTYKLPQYLDLCIRSIRMHTKDYELIVVNNGQDKATLKLLNKYRNIITINNEENLGYCKALNQGVKAASYKMVVLGTNDIIVTPKWLEILRKVYQVNKPNNPGLIGTYFTYASGLQDAVRSRWINQPFITKRVILGCTLTKVKDFWKVGGMDENFPNLGGNYADDDLSRRYWNAGFKNIIAPVLIFHFPSMSYTSGLLSHHEDMKKGEEYYRKKWSDGN
ncbi:MAG: glycosyltransferase [Methanophagales archaeon]|nr:glycosyltransferase [Methanophagales archaeon]